VTATPTDSDSDQALHAFLALNAGYFLGEWLAPRAHRVLVQWLAAASRPLADLPIPDDRLHATLLAQHVREIAAAYGATAWTDAIAGRTVSLQPQEPEDWDAATISASRRLTETGDGHALLLAHARRRLWELGHSSTDAGAATVPAALVRIARRLARTGDGHDIQVAEAALAEAAASPQLARPLAQALQALDSRPHVRRYQTASGSSTPRRSSAVNGRSGSTSHQRRNSYN
jgi:hypothetical protein